MSANILKDAYIIEYDGYNRMIGVVVEDSRFKVGKRLITSAIIHCCKETMLVKTETGTEYKIENFVDRELYNL